LPEFGVECTFRPYESDTPSTLAAPPPAEQAEVASTMLIVSTPSPSSAADPAVHAVVGSIKHLPVDDVHRNLVKSAESFGKLMIQLSLLPPDISACKLM